MERKTHWVSNGIEFKVTPCERCGIEGSRQRPEGSSERFLCTLCKKAPEGNLEALLLYCTNKILSALQRQK